MTLQKSANNVLRQLEDSLNQLTDEQYSINISILSNSSIGHHVRHVLEMFLLLQEGYESGTVNYENRKRDIIIETSKDIAIEYLQKIASTLYSENKDLVIRVGFDKNNDELNSIPSNYYREIAYNLEHSIHHMALIKIGIKEVSDIQLTEGYGTASSTIRYREKILK